MRFIRLKALYLILIACTCGMALTGFVCEEKGCDPLCQDNNARLCLLIDDKQICECLCSIGDIAILIYDANEDDIAWQKKIIPQWAPRYGAIDWCSNNDVPTCRPLKINIRWYCSDIACLEEDRQWYPTINPQVIDAIPCGQSRALYIQFVCGAQI
jgi:hypothetical protein